MIIAYTNGPNSGMVQIPSIELGGPALEYYQGTQDGVSMGTLSSVQNEEDTFLFFPIRFNSEFESIGMIATEDNDFFDIPDFTSTLYAENSSALRQVYTPPRATPEDPNPAPIYPIDIQERWRDKYFYRQEYEGNGYMYNPASWNWPDPSDPSYSGQFFPYPLYEVVDNKPTWVFYNEAGWSFGYCHFWKCQSPEVSYTTYRCVELARIYCNCGSDYVDSDILPPRFGEPGTGSAMFDPDLYDYTYFEKRDESQWNPGTPVSMQRRHIFTTFLEFKVNVPNPSDPTADPEEQEFVAMVSYKLDDNGNLVGDVSGMAISKAFFNTDANTMEDEDDEGEPEFGHGIRPPRVNQNPGDYIGITFDIGVGRVRPGDAGLKLIWTSSIQNLNDMIQLVIQNKTSGIIPSVPGGFDDLINALVAPATDAVLNSIYSSILDTYMLPFAPQNMSASDQLNLAGEVWSVPTGLEVPEKLFWWNFPQQRIIDINPIRIPEISDKGFENYDPYVRGVIALPFCGVFEIPVNAFMGGAITLKYSVDLLSGSCTAYVFGTDRDDHTTLIGTYAGDMKLPVPLNGTAANTGIIGQALRGGVATLGRGLSFANSALGRGNSQPFMKTSPMSTYHYGNETFVSGGNTSLNMSLGNAGMTAGVGLQMISDVAAQAADLQVANPVLSSVVGQIGGCSGWNNFAQPYLRLDMVVDKTPLAFFKKTIGKTANLIKTIRDLAPDTLYVAKSVDPIDIPNATAEEEIEIRRILTTGFYK